MQIEYLLTSLEQKKCWKSYMKTQCRRNQVDPQLANNFTIVKMKGFYQKLKFLKQNVLSHDQPEKPRLKSSVWLENQLKAYQWLLIVMSGYKGIYIKNFRNEDWDELSVIFEKQQSILEYEAIKLIHQRHSIKRKWEQQEIKILEQIVKQTQLNNKWNQIARKLFQLSKKFYFRSGKQCRERWFNHLDPDKNQYICPHASGKWLEEQDKLIVQFILERGRKWSEISKKLNNKRTEHMIKNRYKTILIRLRKQFPHVKKQSELLRIMKEGRYNKHQQQSSSSFQQQDEQEQPHHQQHLKNNSLSIPCELLMQQDPDDNNFQQEFVDQLPSNLRDPEIQQVVTPCPIIYQAFTPNFLNTPHSIPFVINYSFDQFEKTQHSFFGTKQQIK